MNSNELLLARTTVNGCGVKNWPGEWRPGSCSLFLLLLLALLSNRAGAAWQITDFEIVEGFPDWDEVHLDDETFAKDKSGTKLTSGELNEHADWGLHGTGGNLTLTNYFLNKIATQYSKYDLPEPTHLQKSKDGKRYRIYFYDFDVSAYELRALDYDTELVGGRTNINCQPQKNDGKPSWIALNTTLVFPQESEGVGHYAQLLFDSLSHELFHAVQAAAIYAQSEGEEKSYCNGETLWKEGTASAVGIYMANTVYPSYVTSKGGIGYSKQGWFNYRQSWLDAGRALGANDRSRDVYTINPIFRYAMERYRSPHAGKEDFSGLKVAKRFLEDLNQLDKLDSWMNDRLGSINPDMPLPLYFPEFLAHHADSADRYKVDERKWVDALFDTCIPVKLKKGRPSWQSPKGTMLQDNAALCLDVTVTGLKPDECLYVTLAVDREVSRNEFGIMGSADKDIDRLHLSTPKMGGFLAEEGKRWQFDCYGQSLYGFKPRCVITKPLTSKDEDKRVIRSWFTPQQRATGNTLENRYILSAARKKYGGPPKEQLINLTIAAERTSVERDGKKVKCPSSGVDTSIGQTHPHPVTGPLPGTQNQHTNMLPFLVGLGSPDAMDPDKEGISAIVLKEFNDNTPDAELAGKYLFEFRTEKPILFESKGTYPAAISGSRMGNAGGIVGNPGDKPAGSIEVIRFDDQLLHVKVSGRYCLRTLPDMRCRGNYPVSGEVIKPFGWTYDRAQKPRAIFTPGMEPYARLFDGVLPMAPKPATFPTTTPGDSTSASSGSAAAAAATAGSATGASDQTACDCSCAEKNRLGAELKALGDTNSGEGMPDMSRFPMQAMTCMMQCMMQFAACEND